jgi:hypothetical protein
LENPAGFSHIGLSEQTRFDVAVGAVLSYCCIVHVVSAAHTACVLAVAACTSYDVELQGAVTLHTVVVCVALNVVNGLYPFVTTDIVVCALMGTKKLVALLYRNGPYGSPVMIDVVRELLPRPERSVVPCISDNPMSFNASALNSCTPNTPSPAHCARNNVPL